jgi:hypothetical protein
LSCSWHLHLHLFVVSPRLLGTLAHKLVSWERTVRDLHLVAMASKRTEPQRAVTALPWEATASSNLATEHPHLLVI